jgi:hypothetical protein
LPSELLLLVYELRHLPGDTRDVGLEVVGGANYAGVVPWVHEDHRELVSAGEGEAARTTLVLNVALLADAIERASQGNHEEKDRESLAESGRMGGS